MTIGSLPDREMQDSPRADCASPSGTTPATAPGAQAKETITKSKPGGPRNRTQSPASSSSWRASDSQPPPKRGRGRPRIRPLKNAFGPPARHRHADEDMPARNGARPVASVRRPRVSDPYTVLRLKRCETDAAAIRAAYTTATMTCSDRFPGPYQLSDDPDSAGHHRLTLVSDANMILENRRMKLLLDKCLNHHYSKYTGSAVDILDVALSSVHSTPTEQEVERAYNDRMAEWSGYEEVAGVVIRTLKAARETVLRDLRKELEAEQQEQEQKERSRHSQSQRYDSAMPDAVGQEE